MRNVEVDYVLPVSAMPKVLSELGRHGGSKRGAGMKSRQSQRADAAKAADLASDPVPLEGPPSSFICPECGGALCELAQGNLLHYCCHVGHAYTAEALIAGQDDAVEEALWTALRTLDETAAMRRRLADDVHSRHMAHVAKEFQDRAHHLEQRAGVIRKVLLSNKLPGNLRGFASPEPARSLRRQVEQNARTKNLRAARQRKRASRS